MMRVRSLPEFATSFQTDRHEEKKVMIVTVDGGPDENPRYEKTINCSIKYFVENGLDAFFFATNRYLSIQKPKSKFFKIHFLMILKYMFNELFFE